MNLLRKLLFPLPFYMVWYEYAEFFFDTEDFKIILLICLLLLLGILAFGTGKTQIEYLIRCYQINIK
jgi:hypothetical protein